MPQIKIHKLICNVPDEDDKDEIYLVIQKKKVWPLKAKFKKMGVDEAIEIGIIENFQGEHIELELWEYDYTSRNDHLGTFFLEMKEAPGHYGTILTVKQGSATAADYMLNWEIMSK